jgi:hypothetical protein
MLEKKKLNKSVQIDLALPDSGFSPEFTNSLSNICAKYSGLSESYLVLKKEGEDVSLLLGLLFDDSISPKEQEQVIQNIMTEVVGLFSDEIIIEAICLNNNNQLKETIMAIDSPFYLKSPIS